MDKRLTSVPLRLGSLEPDRDEPLTIEEAAAEMRRYPKLCARCLHREHDTNTTRIRCGAFDNGAVCWCESK